MTSAFQRARSEEQRTVRRQAILETASSMLTEMPASRLSLNELSRRVGLAKSNVLRYFESREAVLLELLTEAQRDWLDALPGELTAAVVPSAPLYDRADRTAAVIAHTLAARPVLCDLLAAQAAVLERNVSAQVATDHKRAAHDNIVVLGHLVTARLPELPEFDGFRFAAGALLSAGALWTHAHPTAAVLAAYEADPALAVLRVSMDTSLQELLEVLLAGLLARADIPRGDRTAR